MCVLRSPIPPNLLVSSEEDFITFGFIFRLGAATACLAAVGVRVLTEDGRASSLSIASSDGGYCVVKEVDLPSPDVNSTIQRQARTLLERVGRRLKRLPTPVIETSMIFQTAHALQFNAEVSRDHRPGLLSSCLVGRPTALCRDMA